MAEGGNGYEDDATFGGERRWPANMQVFARKNPNAIIAGSLPLPAMMDTYIRTEKVQRVQFSKW